MKKVCMIVNNPFTNDSRVLKEAKSLAAADYDVTILATKADSLPEIEEISKNIRVIRKLASYNFYSIRSIFLIPKMLITARGLKKQNFSIFHSHDLDTLLFSYVAKVNTKTTFIYDSHELFVEILKSDVGFGFFTALLHKIMLPLWILTEKILIKKTDFVITVNDSIKKELENRYEITDIVTIMNCSSSISSNFSKKEKKFHKIFRLPREAKIVLYQGSLSEKRGLIELIDSFEYITNPVIYLVIMGSGDYKKTLVNYSEQKYYRERIKFLNSVPIRDLLKYTQSADIGVVPMLNVSLNNYLSLPNKLFEYMAVGLPVLSSDFPELKKIITHQNIGYTFNPSDPEDIGDKINYLLSDTAKLEFTSKNSLKSFNERYNWNIEEKKLLGIYNKII